MSFKSERPALLSACSRNGFAARRVRHRRSLPTTRCSSREASGPVLRYATTSIRWRQSQSYALTSTHALDAAGSGSGLCRVKSEKRGARCCQRLGVRSHVPGEAGSVRGSVPASLPAPQLPAWQQLPEVDPKTVTPTPKIRILIYPPRNAGQLQANSPRSTKQRCTQRGGFDISSNRRAPRRPVPSLETCLPSKDCPGWQSK
jgi:hypothetical protein